MTATTEGKGQYRWFTLGDVNGFFGLMFDNMTVLSFLSGILIGIFGFPAEIVFKKMFPGTAFGVLFGDMVYTWMAFRLARKTGRSNITAMPLGLDTPSTIGMAFVLGGVFAGLKAKGMTPDDAAMMTWYIGMATMIFIGLVKLIFSFGGSILQKVIPQAGLLGSLAGIGLALIGMLPLVDIFSLPLVGVVSFGLILYNLVAGIRLPGRFPGVLAAVVIGTALYYILGPMGLTGGKFVVPEAHLIMGFPTPTLEFIKGFEGALILLPIAIPFAILTVVGGINVTESARVAGDDYSTRDILLTEAVATLLAGICGGVAQSTPYIGQPAYKAMGSRAGYTVLTGLFIGLGGILGYISFFVELIPRAVLAPILIFVALDIMVQAFIACGSMMAPAVAMAYFPTVARLLQIKLNPGVVNNYAQAMAIPDPPGKELPSLAVIVALGNGFILTGMLWGAFVAKLIERKLRVSSLYLVILAVLSFFGIIHSALPDGNMYLPWNLAWDVTIPGATPDAPALVGVGPQRIPYLFSSAYLILAVMFFGLSFTKEANEPPEEHHHDAPVPEY